MRVLLWPAALLLWAIGPGVQLTNGRYEWTPLQDFAMWVGYGVSWAFWLTVLLWAIPSMRQWTLRRWQD